MNLLFSKNPIMSQGYTIIPVKELLKIEKDENAVFLFQDENTRADIYSIRGGKYTLSPASGHLGLLIDDKTTLDYILKTRIPIEPKDMSPFEKYIDDIKSLHSKKLIDELFLKLNVSVNMETISKEDYLLIQNSIKAYPKSKKYNDLLIPLGFFIGESILKKHQGEWTLFKEFNYNPYFIPKIKTKKLAQIDPFYKLTEKLLGIEGRKLDLLECIENPFTVEGYYKNKVL